MGAEDLSIVAVGVYGDLLDQQSAGLLGQTIFRDGTRFGEVVKCGCGKLSPTAMIPSPVLRGMLHQAVSEEVDDIAIATLKVGYGIESVEQWLFEKGSGAVRQEGSGVTGDGGGCDLMRELKTHVPSSAA